MIAVSSLGIALMVGLSGANDTVKVSLLSYISDYRYADAVITTELTETEYSHSLALLPGVQQVNPRIAVDVLVRTPGGRPLTVRAFSYGIRDFQQFYVWEQNERADYPNIALDVLLAGRNGIRAGDIIEAKLGDEYLEVCVGRIVSSAECLSMVADPYSWGENSDFGYAFVPEELFYGTEYYDRCDQFLLRFDSWADGDRLLGEAEALLADAGVKNAYLYRDSGVQARVDVNLGPLHTLSVLMPTMFFIVMLAVVSLFLSQIIRQCRRDIGILRALGFEKRRIRLLFCLITLIITLAASVLGLGIAMWLMRLTSRLFADFFPLPHIYWRLNGWVCVSAAAVTVIVGQLSALLGTAMIARVQPSEAMSREAPTAAKTPLWLRRILSSASPAAKFSITSMLRSRKRFLFSVVCVASSIILILSAVAFNESKNGMLRRLYDESLHYDAEIFLKREPSEELLARLSAVEGVSDCEVLRYDRPVISFRGQEEQVTLCSVLPETQHLTVFGLGDDPVSVPESGLILENHTAEALGVQVGDTVLVNSTEMTVTALSYQSIARMSYCAYGSLPSPADQYAVLCNTRNEDALLDFLAEEDSYSHINITHILRAGSEETFALYSVGVEILIIFAVVLGVIIVFNTTQTNLLEQRRELSVLRAIGFQISEISRIWLLQSLLQFVLSCAAGLPIGILVAKYTLAQLATPVREYPLSHSALQYVITAGLVLCYMLASHYAAMGSIRRWDIAENTKEKE